MGLAGTKTRRKIGVDPNNTKWSRNENTFGQKILRAQGWTPGKYLGAEDAAHAEFHTNASSAPIKVLLKDDNLGLGAKPRQKQSAECTGLNTFNDLLGRLNGKSEATIEKEQKVRSDIKTNLYIERRFGMVRFVKGGLLKGDQNEESPKGEDSAGGESAEPEPTEVKKEKKDKKDKKEKKSKKRKADDMDEESAAVEVTEDNDKEKSKKSKKKRSKKDDSSDVDAEDDTSAQETEKKRSKKDKKSKEERKSKNKKDKSKSDDKSERRKRKEEKRRKRALEESATTDNTPTEQSSGVSTPNAAEDAPRQPLSRHHVRARNIASKRLAMADMTALNQILMVKAV